MAPEAQPRSTCALHPAGRLTPMPRPRLRPKHRRLIFVCVMLAVMGAALAVLLIVFKENMMYFYTPSMLAEKQAEPGFDREKSLRLGGLVVPGSVARPADGSIHFDVTDGTAQMQVRYHGLLPTLFREGQGVVLTGTLAPDGSVVAHEILAKHDENYMPPEVADALKKSGHWEGKDQPYGKKTP
jgi:cytochrome c-type biogenesis protein CcmE